MDALLGHTETQFDFCSLAACVNSERVGVAHKEAVPT